MNIWIVLGIGLLNLLAVMGVTPPSPHTHVLALTTFEDLDDGNALKVRVALDDGGLIDNLEEGRVVMSTKDEVYLGYFLGQLQIGRHPGMCEGDNQLAA